MKLHCLTTDILSTPCVCHEGARSRIGMCNRICCRQGNVWSVSSQVGYESVPCCVIFLWPTGKCREFLVCLIEKVLTKWYVLCCSCGNAFWRPMCIPWHVGARGRWHHHDVSSTDHFRWRDWLCTSCNSKIDVWFEITGILYHVVILGHAGEEDVSRFIVMLFK